MINTIIFDFDGVIVDSYVAHVSCYSEVCRTLGKPISPQVFRKAAEGKSNEFFKNLGVPLEQVDEATTLFRRNFPSYPCPIYPGIPELLIELKSLGNNLAIATSNQMENVRLHLSQHLGLFDKVEAMNGKYVPKSESLKRIISALGNHAVLVGDMRWDYDASQEAGIPFLGVSYGGWQDHSQETRFQVIPSVAELRRVLFTP